MTCDVIVIGGGAAGMFAAGVAAERGRAVTLLERNPRLGIKLGLTGNGRCNLTNTDEPAELLKRFERNGTFLHNAIARFSNRDIVERFGRLGLPTRVEEGGRIFPARGGAARVIETLERRLREMGVAVHLGARAESVLLDSGGTAVRGVTVAGGGGTFEAGGVILATGGMSYPSTGSTGDGYAIAARAGHTIVRPRPALVPLETVEAYPRDLQGVTLKGVSATVLVNGRKARAASGDLVFTHFGLSGPVVLSASGFIVERLDEGARVEISIGLLPGLDRVGVEAKLLRELEGAGRKSAGTVVKGLVPRAMAPLVLSLAGIGELTKGSQVTAAERKRLAALLSDFRLAVKGPRPIEEAIVTRGGVDVREIDPRTMESKKTQGLYFCGEVIDVDGDSGGYNLTAAFSTAYAAGSSVFSGPRFC